MYSWRAVLTLTDTPQPMMYQAIKKHAPVLEKYAQSLIEEGTVSQEEYKVGVWR